MLLLSPLLVISNSNTSVSAAVIKSAFAGVITPSEVITRGVLSLLADRDWETIAFQF